MERGSSTAGRHLRIRGTGSPPYQSSVILRSGHCSAGGFPWCSGILSYNCVNETMKRFSVHLQNWTIELSSSILIHIVLVWHSTTWITVGLMIMLVNLSVIVRKKFGRTSWIIRPRNQHYSNGNSKTITIQSKYDSRWSFKANRCLKKGDWKKHQNTEGLWQTNPTRIDKSRLLGSGVRYTGLMIQAQRHRSVCDYSCSVAFAG